MFRYPGLWFAFNSGCQSASVLITSILICYYNFMKTSFHYMNDYKYTHMTNSCYKFSGSSINRQDALTNTLCEFKFPVSFRSLVESSVQPYIIIYLFQMFCYQYCLSCLVSPKFFKWIILWSSDIQTLFIFPLNIQG